MKVCVACELVKLAKELMAADWGYNSPYKNKHSLDEAGDKMRHEAFKVFHAVLDLSPSAKLQDSTMLTMTEGSSNKFHFFCIFEDNGVFKGGNAYGRIGGNVSAIQIAVGRRSEVQSAVDRKMRTKQAKGYQLS